MPVAFQLPPVTTATLKKSIKKKEKAAWDSNTVMHDSKIVRGSKEHSLLTKASQVLTSAHLQTQIQQQLNLKLNDLIKPSSSVKNINVGSSARELQKLTHPYPQAAT